MFVAFIVKMLKYLVTNIRSDVKKNPLNINILYACSERGSEWPGKVQYWN